MSQKINAQKKFASKKKFYGPKNRGLQKLHPKCLVKIGSVTAKIILIWTNVTRTNVTMKDASDNLVFVSKGNIQNLIPLLYILAVEKFLWW